MTTRDLKNRLEKAAQGKRRLKVVYAPPGVDRCEYHKQEFDSRKDVVVLDDDDRNL